MLRRLFGLLRSRSVARPSPARPVPGPPSHVSARAQPRPGSGVPPPARDGQALDYDGPVDLSYAPRDDDDPDPGEVVWTWVPFEEDPSVGKDRPVVVIGRPHDGRQAGALAVVMLSTKDHHTDPRWLVLGSGAWDAEDRVSSVRLDRVLAVTPGAVRREGAALDRPRFDRIAAALRARHGWR